MRRQMLKTIPVKVSGDAPEGIAIDFYIVWEDQQAPYDLDRIVKPLRCGLDCHGGPIRNEVHKPIEQSDVEDLLRCIIGAHEDNPLVDSPDIFDYLVRRLCQSVQVNMIFLAEGVFGCSVRAGSVGWRKKDIIVNLPGVKFERNSRNAPSVLEECLALEKIEE